MNHWQFVIESSENSFYAGGEGKKLECDLSRGGNEKLITILREVIQ